MLVILLTLAASSGRAAHGRGRCPVLAECGESARQGQRRHLSASGTGRAGVRFTCTITRPDGSTQATYDGHPLYTYAGDTAAGQAKGNGLNLSGGVWHEVTVSGGAAPAASTSPSAHGGYGY